MKHLTVLEEANLIKVEREGRKRWNILNDDLARFLRTKLTNDDGPYRLVDILGLLPGQKPAAPMVSMGADPIRVEQSILLQASPSQVFEALTVDIDAWWSLRVSTGSQIQLEPTVNGRFYEAFNSAGQGILYATVTYIKDGEELHLKGTMELTEQVADTSALDNIVRITLVAQDEATQLSLSHRIAGGVDRATRDICDRRWHDILNQDLKPFVENGIFTKDNP
jgi:hypothetical protein